MAAPACDMNASDQIEVERLTWRQRLESAAAQYERAEKELGKRYALKELASQLDTMWKMVAEEQHELLKEDIRMLGI